LTNFDDRKSDKHAQAWIIKKFEVFKKGVAYIAVFLVWYNGYSNLSGEYVAITFRVTELV
jgi:hypothetical protein